MYFHSRFGGAGYLAALAQASKLLTLAQQLDGSKKLGKGKETRWIMVTKSGKSVGFPLNKGVHFTSFQA